MFHFRQCINNDENVKITIRPDSIGNISIIGSTEDVHKEAFSKINQQSIEVIIEEEEEEITDRTNTQDVLEKWKTAPIDNSFQDYSVVLIIMGIIAGIIIGVIIKIKKN